MLIKIDILSGQRYGRAMQMIQYSTDGYIAYILSHNHCVDLLISGQS